MLPADVTGTEIFNPKEGTYSVKQGPIFSNLVLADEINRAPAKVQAALLEAMQERQTTIGGKTFKMAEPFLVLATQNPIEQEGTYPLPEAQLDRFLLHVLVDYPDAAGEHAILALNRSEQKVTTSDADLFAAPEPLTQKEIRAARLEVLETHLAEPLEEYIVQVVLATRHPERYGDDLAETLHYGASPRATIALDRSSRAHAWLSGRDFVTPEDVQAVAHDVLRHRLLLSFEAEAAGRVADDLVNIILERVGVP
jgi:MoxR-like ATPase